MPSWWRSEPEIPVVVASAAQVRLYDEDPEQLSSRAQRVGQALAWQQESWRWYQQLGEVWYSHTWKGNAIAGVHWLIGVADPNTGDIVPARGVDGRLAAGVDEGLLALAQASLDRLVGPNGSHSEWARPLGTSMSCVAEGWLVGYFVNEDGDPVEGVLVDTVSGAETENPDAAFMVWDACSPTELNKVVGDNGKPRFTMIRSAEAEPTRLPADTVGVRIWRRSPRFADDADGPMMALLDVCEDLYLLRMSVRGSALSRTHAGLLLIPTEGLGEPLSSYANRVSGGGTGQGPPPNPVITELIAGLSTPHKDPGSAASVVPTTITTKSDHIDHWKHLALTRDIDPETSKQREELIRAYATGIDLPPERLLGMADLNHWTAWQIGEDSWRHVDPDCQCIADGITSGYLWPDMIASLEDRLTDDEDDVDPAQRDSVRAFRITFDPTPAIISPDRSDDADDAFDRGAISWPAYRRYKHFPETDAPTVEELEERALLGFSGRAAPTPAGPGDAEVGPAGTDPPSQARARAAGQQLSLAAAHAIHERQTVRAALQVTGTMERYARACARIETTFLREVLLAVDSAVDEAVRKAQARIRSIAQRDGQLRARIRGVPNSQLVTILGRREVARIRAAFEAEDETSTAGIFDGALALLLARYAELSTTAQAEWRRLAEDQLGVEFSADELAELEADLAASTITLEQGARAAAEAALLGTAAAVAVGTLGEVPAGVTIPPIVVRRAAARAGGAPVAGGIDPLPEGWAGGLTTGPTIDQFLERRGFVAAGIVWNYGSVTSRKQPYLPHVELDGIEVASLEDYLGFYPGDHGGCQCAIGRLYATDDGDTAEVTSLDPSELP
jgi:hypothetical protein